MKKSLIYIAITAILFATLEPISKLIANDVNPFAITAIRFFIGSFLLLPGSIQALKKAERKLTGKDMATLAVLGVLCVCVSMPLLQFAVKLAPSATVIAVVFSSNSVFTMLFAALLLKEKITGRKVIAIVLCLIGLIISTDFSGGSSVLPVVLAILSAMTFSVYAVFTKRTLPGCPSIVKSFFNFLYGGIVLAIALPVMGVNPMEGVTLSNAWVLVYLGLAVTGLGYWAYFKAIDTAGVLAGSFAFFLKPVLSPIVMLVLYSAMPSWNVLVSIVLVVLGAYMATNTQPLLKKK